MRIPSSGQRRLGINLTPMIDVVFQLIIFFLVSSQLAQRESNLPLPLPEVNSGDAPTDDPTGRITLNLETDGQLSVGGRVIDEEQLTKLLDEAIGLRGEDVEVRIRASRETPYRHAEKLMMACTKKGIWNVTYAVYRRQESSP